MDQQPETWRSAGETVAVWLPFAGPVPSLPLGVHRIGHHLLLTASRYDDSPIGPYTEIAVLTPARLGLRVGFSAVTVVVDTPAARRAAERAWGVPAALGHLGWHATATHRRIVWEERRLDLVATLDRRSHLPLVVPGRVLQHRRDGHVVVNGLARGSAWLAGIDISLPAGDPLAEMDGHHRGRYVQGLRLSARPARRPVAGAFSFQAPPLPADAMPAGVGPPMVACEASRRRRRALAGSTAA